MKGTIHKCVEKLVIEKFGIDKWEECLESVGLDEDHVFMMNDDVDEAKTMELLTKAPAILGISLPQLFDAFGEYWSCVYAPKVYPAYYEGVNNSKEFLLKLDRIHVEITQNVPNARPPRFTYSWSNENTLLMEYTSGRGLVDLFISLAHGMGKYFNETLGITKDNNKVTIVFPS
ncbi:MAG: heme NO-binding domain-containing protein [Luteibaculaceae bacterium]